MSADLSRRLVSAPGFRPMAGMLWVWGSAADPMCRRQDIDVGVAGALPDLDDPATLGCLLALVREAWGEPNACVCFNVNGCVWYVHVPNRFMSLADASSEADSLVAALEAAKR